VSFLPAASGPVPASYTVTPYIAGAAQSSTTVSAGSAGSITGSNGSTYAQVPVSGLANGTAYTFSVHASNAAGNSPESAQSGANTPLSGLVFGDDFNGPSGGPVDPEWWVYTRCGYLAQNEIEYYLPSQVTLDGSSNLLLTALKQSHTGPSYPSAGGGSKTQPWISGAVQSNTKTYQPSPGNTMTFEARTQICPDISGGMFPGLLWLEGDHYLDLWKTDPAQSAGGGEYSEIDVQEWWPGFTPPDTTTAYHNNVHMGGSGDFQHQNTGATDFSAALHVFSAQWKPGVSVKFFLDGAQTSSTTSVVPGTDCNFFLLLYLQILAGSATATQSCVIDYVRVYDQNLG